MTSRCAAADEVQLRRQVRSQVQLGNEGNEGDKGVAKQSLETREGERPPHNSDRTSSKMNVFS